MRQIPLFPGLERTGQFQNGNTEMTKKKKAPFEFVPPERMPDGSMKYSDDFEEFWAAYPRRIAKADAYMYYQKAIWKGYKRGLILIRATQFAQSGVGMGVCKHIPYPGTWLNQLRFLDDPKDWDRFGGAEETKRASEGVDWNYKE